MTTTARFVPVVAVAVLVLAGTACSSEPSSNNGTPSAAAKSSTGEPRVIEFVAHTGNDFIDAEIHHTKKQLRPLYEQSTRAFYLNRVWEGIPQGDLYWKGFQLFPAEDKGAILVANHDFLEIHEKEFREAEKLLREYGVDPLDVLSREERNEIEKPHMDWHNRIMDKFDEAGFTTYHSTP